MHNCYCVHREWSDPLPARLTDLVRLIAQARPKQMLMRMIDRDHPAATAAPTRVTYTVTCGWLEASIISPRCVITASINP